MSIGISKGVPFVDCVGMMSGVSVAGLNGLMRNCSLTASPPLVGSGKKVPISADRPAPAMTWKGPDGTDRAVPVMRS